jgi:hypothetical protein
MVIIAALYASPVASGQYIHETARAPHFRDAESRYRSLPDNDDCRIPAQGPQRPGEIG